MNTTFETFRFRGLKLRSWKQREGEDFQSFIHRCEVAVDRYGFHKGVSEAQGHHGIRRTPKQFRRTFD